MEWQITCCSLCLYISLQVRLWLSRLVASPGQFAQSFSANQRQTANKMPALLSSRPLAIFLGYISASLIILQSTHKINYITKESPTVLPQADSRLLETSLFLKLLFVLWQEATCSLHTRHWKQQNQQSSALTQTNQSYLSAAHSSSVWNQCMSVVIHAPLLKQKRTPHTPTVLYKITLVGNYTQPYIDTAAALHPCSTITFPCFMQCSFSLWLKESLAKNRPKKLSHEG